MSFTAVTPLLPSPAMSSALSTPVLIKLENLHPPGSYKLRGMSYKANLAKQRGAAHLVAASGGNAGLAVAYSASLLHLKCSVYVPSSTPPQTRQLIESYSHPNSSISCISFGSVYADADKEARRVAKENPESEYFSAYDDPELWTGHSSIIDEIKDQTNGVKPRCIVLSVGGGGLLCGVAEGLAKNSWEDVPIVAMETVGANCFALAKKEGKIVEMRPTGVAKSLMASKAAERTLEWDKKMSITSVEVEERMAVWGCDMFANKHRMVSVAERSGVEWSGVEWSGVEWSGAGCKTLTLTPTLTQTNKQTVG